MKLLLGVVLLLKLPEELLCCRSVLKSFEVTFEALLKLIDQN
jgi:hypothetical protein